VDLDGGATQTSALLRDTDGGGTPDSGEDFNANGIIDNNETDPRDPESDFPIFDLDFDGMSNPFETTLGLNTSDADTDDDGVPDGLEPNPTLDMDFDGLIDTRDPDSDNDGLADGTELGFGCGQFGTLPDVDRCRPDLDPTTRTFAIVLSSDRGSAGDGSEDANLNGRVDPGESDPNLDVDDSLVLDSDFDGLSDALELLLCLDPNDADTDDDGVGDGDEANPTLDMDGDVLVDARDSDSDNDGLFDGTEVGATCEAAATDVTKGQCVPDADEGTQQTSPVMFDTDGGGFGDGGEDSNFNGRVEQEETDPTDASDDFSTTNEDSDGDGLSYYAEQALGTSPFDRDSDDDGVLDGQEANPSANTDLDGDGLLNAMDPDSDGDGLLDTDHDGLKDPVDDCPTDPEDFDDFEDGDGCPELDNDKDGIADRDDKCPNDPADMDKFQDEDGCPDPDNDQDGIPDRDDKCPNDPEDKDKFQDEDGCPDPDNDKDGILDPNDKCPNEPESRNDFEDDDGCPDVKAEVTPDEIKVDMVYFDRDKATIKPESLPVLDAVVRVMKSHPEIEYVEVQGHTDERAPDAYNLGLSDRRAKAVVAYLIKNGVEKTRLRGKGYGETMPLVNESNEAAWAKNRRVVFQIVRRAK
jgi:outer membrane protein OmpA-like peptidoglycan-associated protein